MYYIYHIPERNKIGVSNSLKVRMKKHKWTGSYEILEEHTCEFKVSDREVELQIEYYGKRDNNRLYWQTLKAHSTESRSKGGKKSGKIAVESGQLQSVQSKGAIASNKLKRKLTYETAEYIRAQYKRGNDVFGKKISQRRLARVFDINQESIFKIIHNKTYTTP
jgi:hypothetical protein